MAAPAPIPPPKAPSLSNMTVPNVQQGSYKYDINGDGNMEMIPFWSRQPHNLRVVGRVVAEESKRLVKYSRVFCTQGEEHYPDSQNYPYDGVYDIILPERGKYLLHWRSLLAPSSKTDPSNKRDRAFRGRDPRTRLNASRTLHNDCPIDRQ